MSSRYILKTLLPDSRIELPTLLEGRINLLTLDRSRIELNTTVPRAIAPPVNTVAPVVAPDDPFVGILCTCSTGTWTGATPITYTYQWYEFDGSNSFILTGETASVYTATIANLGNQLYCIVTATNSDGSASETSNYTANNVLNPIVPVNTVAPVISGTVAIGQTLTLTSVGTWTGLPAPTFSYQWRIDGAYIAGAVGTTYVIQAGEENGVFDCLVFGTNIAGTVSAESNELSGAAPPVNLTAPVISGTVRIGSTLSTTDGTWDNSPTSYTYQWTRNGSPIGSATNNTYSVVAADINAEIECEVTAINGAGNATETSNILTSPWRPILLARPSVLIFDGLDPYCYNNASVSGSVTTINTVNGIQIGTQGLSGSRATRLASSLSFDGTDDHYICNTHASLTGQAHTLIFGFDNPEDTTTSVRTLFCASAGSSSATTRQTSVNYSRPGSPNATRQRYYISETSSITASLLGYSIGAGPYNLALRAAAPGGTMRADRLDGSLTSISSATRSADDAIGYVWCYLGVRAVGATPSLAQYWQGDIRHFAIDDENWDDIDTALYRTCAIAAGVMV